ncbi:MAG: hypothetical protein M3375_05845 [Actinomycetota bacterium]|nr:hypothetical protein [Actinomycetota bacterium]
MAKPIAVCLALGGLSLLLPSEPSYDPWAWMVWGREVAHLDLDTNGGPSFKPLPVLVMTILSPFSKLDDGIPPDLWLVIARAGGLLALYMAFRLAGRLAGGPPAVRYGAGVLAAVALLLTPLWLRYMAHGNEAPMAIFFLLWAIERHLEARRNQALILGFLACLLRPEVAPFVGAYGAYLFWKAPELRKLAVGLAIALPIVWLVPEWIGSGNPLGAGQKATGEPPWSLSLRDRPWLAALERAHALLGLALEIGVLAAVALAIRAREKPVLWLTGAAAAWVGLIVLMTQLGFSGNSRYFLVPLAIACVVGAAGAGRLVRLAPRLPAQVAVAALICVGAGLYVSPRLGRIERQARSIDRLVQLQDDLKTSVDRAGGPDAVVARGFPTVNRGFVTRLAWEVKLPIGDVEGARGEGVIFAARSRQAGTAPKQARRADIELRFRQGRWRVFTPRGQSVASTTE